MLVHDVYEFFEQKKLTSIRSDTGSNQDATDVSLGKLRFDNLFGGLSMVYKADLGFVAAFVKRCFVPPKTRFKFFSRQPGPTVVIYYRWIESYQQHVGITHYLVLKTERILGLLDGRFGSVGIILPQITWAAASGQQQSHSRLAVECFLQRLRLSVRIPANQDAQYLSHS